MSSRAIRPGIIGLAGLAPTLGRRILASGFPLQVFDRDPERRQSMVATGAEPVSSVAALTGTCNVILLDLPTDNHAAGACLTDGGHGGLMSHLRPDQWVLDISPVSHRATLDRAAAAAARGARYVDLAVLAGRPADGGDRLLAGWGGSAGDLDPLAPLLGAFAATSHHMGPVGSGQATRLVHSLIRSATLAAALEALVLAAKTGVAPAVMLPVVLASSGGSVILEQHGSRVLTRDFAAGGSSLEQVADDLEAAMALGRRYLAPTPLAAVSHGWVLSMLRRGYGDQHATALLTLCEELAGFHLSEGQGGAAPGLRQPAAPAAQPRVGFIGLGRMGRPMAESALRAGLKLVVQNRSQAVVDALVQQGAERAGTPAEVAARCDVIFTCVTDNPALERVCFGPDGLVAALRPGSVLIETGTTSLALTRRVHEAVIQRGAHFMDAPVSGGPGGAAKGALTIMIGASEDGFRLASPVLAAVGTRLFHMGTPGAGQVTKQVNNIIMYTNFAIVCEGLSLGCAAGLPAGRLLDLISHSDATSYIMNQRGPRAVARDFNASWTTSGQLKDSVAVLGLAHDVHAPVPLSALAHELYQSIAARGLEAEDWLAVVKVFEGLAGVTVGPPPLDIRD